MPGPHISALIILKAIASSKFRTILNINLELLTKLLNFDIRMLSLERG